MPYFQTEFMAATGFKIRMRTAGYNEASIVKIKVIAHSPCLNYDSFDLYDWL